MKNVLMTQMGLSGPKEEHFALWRYVLNIACSCTLIGLLLLIPELDAAFSWVEG